MYTQSDDLEPTKKINFTPTITTINTIYEIYSKIYMAVARFKIWGGFALPA